MEASLETDEEAGLFAQQVARLWVTILHAAKVKEGKNGRKGDGDTQVSMASFEPTQQCLKSDLTCGAQFVKNIIRKKKVYFMHQEKKNT